MRPNRVTYQRAESLSEAVRLLGANPDAKLLAGGHSLIPAMSLRLAQPDTLVDIGRIEELKGIRLDGADLVIGALSTHAQISSSRTVTEHCPLLAAACGVVGDPQVRNWGTLGGNLAHADPASDPPTALLAAGGRIRILGVSGFRQSDADRFFIDLFTVDLQADELITAIEIPSQFGLKTAYAKLAHPASRYALVGVGVTLNVDADGVCVSARVAVGGAVPYPIRSAGAEEALTGSDLGDAAVDEAAQALKQDLGDEVLDDIHAPRDYRRAMAGVYLKRAVRAAAA